MFFKIKISNVIEFTKYKTNNFAAGETNNLLAMFRNFSIFVTNIDTVYIYIYSIQ